MMRCLRMVGRQLVKLALFAFLLAPNAEAQVRVTRNPNSKKPPTRVERGYTSTTYFNSGAGVWTTINQDGTVPTSGASTLALGTGEFTDAYGNSRWFIAYTTSAVLNNSNGIMLTGTNQFFVQGWARPHISFHIYVVDTANVRIRVGVANTIDQANDGAATDIALVFRYSTGASDTNWMVQTADGSVSNVVDSSIAVAANTGYHFTIDWTESGTIVYAINDTTVHTATANLPSDTTTNGFAFWFGITNLVGGVTKTFKVGAPVLMTEDW